MFVKINFYGEYKIPKTKGVREIAIETRTMDLVSSASNVLKQCVQLKEGQDFDYLSLKIQITSNE